MVSFQRMKEEFDDFGVHVSNKFPVIGRGACVVISALSMALIFVIIIAIWLASTAAPRPSDNTSVNSRSTVSVPSYLFHHLNNQSCPPLVGGRLLTTMDEGQSFEGLVVSLSCRGGYNAFPNQIKCRRKSPQSPELEWSHVPVCYPSLLISKAYWSQTLHARSVSCNGDSSKTVCRIACINDYIAVERRPFVCTNSPCNPWTMGESRCYMCDEKCKQLHGIDMNPNPEAIVESLGCSPKCTEILENTMQGQFIKTMPPKSFLFFSKKDTEWLIGPDFRKLHGGIQILAKGSNNELVCPDHLNTRQDVTKLYIDSSSPSTGAGNWLEDDSINVKCLEENDFKAAVTCPCSEYKVYNLVYENSTVPKTVEYLTGNFSLNEDKRRSLGLLSPLYEEGVKGLYLFSHHPRGRVWLVSSTLSSTPMRGIYDGEGSACPDNNQIKWEWFNATTPQGQQLFVQDRNIVIKCTKKL
ncbi:unnamed protein product [Lepeophtheirus salmonis]|uniref:(salmon louse) hypothetical protein n=1 Tax=Lepeophtheirus salmonis TaxID=72036 RepID=A0A7R8CIQ4_LEPSM|nr:unnamed protein product [Lepeophtheirus salmonis]CAF2832660.1 unnamed protein product [Lepeophtheirus salmonis]